MGNEECDYAVDPKTGWRFHRQSRGNLQTPSSGSWGNLQTASSSSSTWNQTHWETSNWNSKHSSTLTTGVFFSKLGQVLVAWRKTSSQPTGRVNSISHGGCRHVYVSGGLATPHPSASGSCALCEALLRRATRSGPFEQYTHKYSTYRVAQHDHSSLREHAWLKSWKAQECTSLCPQNNCHPRVMSHLLPHSPISSTSHIFPTVSPSQTSPMILNLCITPAMFHGRVTLSPSHLSQVMSPRRLSSKTSRSSLETSRPEELSLEGILGQIRIKYREDF